MRSFTFKLRLAALAIGEIAPLDRNTTSSVAALRLRKKKTGTESAIKPAVPAVGTLRLPNLSLLYKEVAGLTRVEPEPLGNGDVCFRMPKFYTQEDNTEYVKYEKISIPSSAIKIIMEGNKHNIFEKRVNQEDIEDLDIATKDLNYWLDDIYRRRSAPEGVYEKALDDINRRLSDPRGMFVEVGLTDFLSFLRLGSSSPSDCEVLLKALLTGQDPRPLSHAQVTNIEFMRALVEVVDGYAVPHILRQVKAMKAPGCNAEFMKHAFKRTDEKSFPRVYKLLNALNADLMADPEFQCVKGFYTAANYKGAVDWIQKNWNEDQSEGEASANEPPAGGASADEGGDDELILRSVNGTYETNVANARGFWQSVNRNANGLGEPSAEGAQPKALKAIKADDSWREERTTP